ncbi:MAG: asparagine synthase-related protein [Acidobacteriota bacterium]|nr:asparagine synthase-related protein [Acidobacteriota bacterium]
MGGLSAIIHFDRSPLDRETLVRMTDAAAHRGPQGTSYALGHHAGLAALTLLPSRSRPGARAHSLASSDVGVDLVADARLDRRDELRRQLSAAGQALPDQALVEGPTDAELLLAAYLAWGEGCPQRLSGDFAFVVWDRRHRRAFCARDRFGVKPLHYLLRDRRLYVASEAQQLLRGLGLRAQLDEVAVADYLMDDSRDEERTFFVGLQRLPSASVLVVKSGRRQVRSYWRPSESGEPGLQGRELEEEARRLLQEAVEERLPTDDPVVGLTMSGGLDSCSVAALAQSWSRSPVAGDSQGGDSVAGTAASRPQLLALSYVFPSLEDCDERAYSGAMARELGVEVEPIDAEKLWLLGDEADFAPSLEGPFQGWESTDRVLLERLRQRDGRVLLTGFGGDNLFAGSRRVYLSRLRRGELSALADVVRRARCLDISVARAAYYYLAAPALPGLDGTLRRWLGRPSLSSPPRWIEPRFAERVGLSQRLRRNDGERLFRDPARQAHWRAVRCLESVGRACSWLDRTAARHGVEVRHPFLDHELAELVLAVDPAEHQGTSGAKLLLRRAMKDHLPETVRQRRDKTRFAAFIEHSLRRRQQRIDELLRQPLVAELGFVDGARLRRSWQDYLDGRAGYMLRHIWYVLTLELWLRKFYEPSASALVPAGLVQTKA